MSHNILYFPSGHGPRVRDRCHRCGSPDFAGQVVMAYDRQAAAVYLICEHCYQRCQANQARIRREAAVQAQATQLLENRIPRCACGD